MKREQIMDVIKSFARSQGFYSRLYMQLMDLDEDDYNKVMSELEGKDFRTSLDVVMFFEC